MRLTGPCCVFIDWLIFEVITKLCTMYFSRCIVREPWGSNLTHPLTIYLMEGKSLTVSEL